MSFICTIFCIFILEIKTEITVCLILWHIAIQMQKQCRQLFECLKFWDSDIVLVFILGHFYVHSFQSATKLCLLQPLKQAE